MTAYLKTSNIVTVLFLIAMCWHFGTVVGLFGTAPLGQSDMFVRLGVIVGAIVIGSILVAMRVQSTQGVPMLPDEREEKIERVSEGIGTFVIYIGLLLLAWFVFTPLTPVQMVNGLLLVVAVTELIKLLIVLYLHRKEDF